MVTTHEDLMQNLAEQFRPVFEASPDGVYLWLDETDKLCNERLAALFGYTAAEWSMTAPFLERFVDEDDQQIYAANYQRSVASLTGPTTFRFRGRHKDGSTFPAETDMIPISFGGHAVAYHFVRRVSA